MDTDFGKHSIEDMSKVVFDQSVDTFRFAHLTVDEYLTTKLTEVESHILIAQTCLSLLCSPDYHQNYDQTVRTAEGNYARRNILFYSAIFWPWHSAHCGPLSHSDHALTAFWGKIVARYCMWLGYFRSVVQLSPEIRDPFWQKLAGFSNHWFNGPLALLSIVELNPPLGDALKSRPHAQSHIENLILH